MKQLFILSLAGLLIAAAACRKESEPPRFDYQKAAGIWVPYEYIDGNGTAHMSSPAGNFFGVYAESVKLNSDRSFIPVTWVDSTNYTLKLDEKGVYEYLSDRNVLVFNGLWRMEMDLIQFQDPELWLKDGDTLYKFRKKF